MTTSHPISPAKPETKPADGAQPPFNAALDAIGKHARHHCYHMRPIMLTFAIDYVSILERHGRAKADEIAATVAANYLASLPPYGRSTQ